MTARHSGTRASDLHRNRRGVLLLVVLSMLTLFMLLGVTYLVHAARTRATSRAFLRLENDLTANALKVRPYLRDAALQAIRGTTNAGSAIRNHDLLGDKYGTSTTLTVQSATFAANRQLVRLQVGTTASPTLAGCVLTFLSGPEGVQNSSVRIADAATLPAGAATAGYVWVPRPPALTNATSLAGGSVRVNGRDFSGTGFSRNSTIIGAGKTYLNDGALMPNRSYAFSSTFDGLTNSSLTAADANEDYDAVDEQNMALAWADGSALSYVRPELVSLWVRDYYRRQQAQGLTPAGTTQQDAERELRQAIFAGVDRTTSFASGTLGLPQIQTLAIHALRRASMRPFAFDHYQNDASTTDLDFAGRSLASLSSALSPTYPNGMPQGDVDNDGDGVKESVWLDVGQGVLELSDGKLVKPLFAIHCVDLGGRIALNAHGSPAHTADVSVTANASYAPRRDDSNGTGAVTVTPPSRLRGGLGFGPADVRLDAVVSANGLAAVMFGVANPSSSGFGVQRDIGSVVGRYGDGIGSVASPALPGTPGVNDRRVSADRTIWTDRGLPTQWTRRLTDPNGDFGVFMGGPPDTWSRLAVGVDHRGHAFYAPRTTMTTMTTTDNPYELDLYRNRQGMPYVQSTAAAANVDQPFTAADLEALLRPYDVDNAMATPPRLLAMAMATAGGQATLDRWRLSLTTDTWDVPTVCRLLPTGSTHDPDLVAGLKMDLNRPFGDALDNDGDTIVDEPRETGDAYAGTFTNAAGYTSATNWLLTRGELPYGATTSDVPPQPGLEEPHLRARQLYAFHIFNLLRHLKQTFETTAGTVRLFAVKTDDDTSQAPVAVDSNLNSGTNGNAATQALATEMALAQWAVNVVDFIDPDAIMTPFRYKQPTASPPGNQYVVWGCEHPDVMITETLAFHDRRTADTKGDPTGETTADFRNEYTTVYNAWMADNSKPKPDPNDSDNNPDLDDVDFDQVRIPEGSLFLELYGLRNPNLPNLPQELYSFDAVSSSWYLDIGRVPAGGTDPVWRLAIADSRIQNAANDVFKQISDHPDTTPLTSGTSADKVADLITIDRYVWLSATPPATSGTGATLNNTFYRRDTALPAPKLKPGGYLVVGPRRTTALGSIDTSSGAVGGQKWGTPSKQQIVLDSVANPAVVVYDLKGNASPGVSAASVPGATFGNPLPPASLPETTATWVSMQPPASWTQSNATIGLNVSEPLRSNYYPEPTVTNGATGVKDAYGPLDSDTHTSFLNVPVDRAGGPLAAGKLLSGGSYANYRNVFVERLADPSRPFQPDATSSDWNPYVVVDFMPVDLTVFNGESPNQDPSETQGPDRVTATAELPLQLTVPATPPDPSVVPLPFAASSLLTRRHTYFHSRQRGFGVDLPNYDNDRTLFGVGTAAIQRNGHPFKPVGGLDDLKDTPATRTGAAPAQQPGGLATTPRDGTSLAADEKACFLHELGQSPAGRTTASSWSKVPYHSLGWVNSSFGRRLDAADGIPAQYAGVPDRPFPWLVWNDRLFANVAELVFVPMAGPARLLSNYRNLDYPSTNYGNTTSPYNTGDMFGACTPGAHLLPITSVTDVPASGATRTRAADVFSALFDYVRVRSPFVSSETVVAGLGDDGRSDRFVGPFNRVSRYREPGRVNINTIPRDATIGGAIWNSICGDETGNFTPPFTAITSSGTFPLAFSTTDLSQGTGVFPRAFRTAAATSSSFGPNAYASNTLFSQSLLTNPPCTSSAAWFVSAASGGSGPIPTIKDTFTSRSFTLLRDGPIVSGTATQLFPPPAPDAWANDPDHNAWFRFESLVRARANSTIRSEVYAIWVTMGLFEVVADATTVADPSNTPVPLYGDGYRLVREYGSDSGDLQRHRAFYIFDRSVPVGYQPGTDLNVNDAILVERFIE